MAFSKKYLIQTLNIIAKEQNLDVNLYVNDVLKNDIPVSSLIFINKYKPLSELGVLNLIYNKKNKTPLFKNFKKGNIDNYEQVVCLGSLLTQMLCYIKTTKDDVTKHSKIIGIESILYAINDFINTGEFNKVNIVYNNFSELFKELYSNIEE